ncbi:ATPase, T2SS/T4P/T4SS family [Halosegnis marinus]|uniref:ATPase, T2SS/T4P/T4SS family n=1 Tax=Halosegnis marinus TaxID=3034023 RepID=UPI003610E45F
MEDTREIDLPHENWIQSVTRSSASGEGRGEVSMYNLLQAALRQRPEYLLVGEIRTEQKVALTFFQAMGTGHTAYTTIHADSIETVLSRLQNPPLSIPTQMLQDLDIVSVQRQTFIGDRRVRRNAGVYELGVAEDDPDEIAVNRVFEWDPTDDTHRELADSNVLAEIAHDRGWSDEELAAEIERRERVLAYLLDSGVSGYRAIAGTIHMYAKDPDYVIERLDAGALDPAALGEHVPLPEGFVEVEAPDRPPAPVASEAEAEIWNDLVREADRERRSVEVEPESEAASDGGEDDVNSLFDDHDDEERR